MDWNWFYSAIAQSTAAIVAIFGAFVFTKIINNQTEFQRRKARYRELELRAHRLIDEANHRYFHWYNERTLEDDLDSISSTLEREEDLKDPDSYLEEQNFSPYIPRSKILKLIEDKINREKYHREHPDRHSGLPAHFMLTELEKTTRRQVRASLRSKLEAERDAIDNLLISTKDHVRQVREFLSQARLNTESSSLITFSIIMVLALFFSGVIYPLTLLPVGTSQTIGFSLGSFWQIAFSLKGAILVIVGCIFSVIMIVFLVINWSLRFTKSKLEEFDRYGDLSTYSPYFKIHEENLSAKKESGKGD